MTSACHHVALRVADIDRAAAFYVEVLGGRFLTLPTLFDGESAATVMGGPPGTSFKQCKIGFDAGAVELFQFVGPHVPDWATRRTGQRLPHFALVVDDVQATLERVEQAGGSRLWPEPMPWGTARTLYIADPDGNVVELVDAPLEEIVATSVQLFPASDPARAQRSS